MECDPYSFMGALLSCAQLGLEPGSGLGHVYLIPYGKNVNMQLGYKGMIDLARRSGQIVSLTAHDVYAKDEFSYELGLNEALIHKPYMDGDRGEFVCVYAVAKLVGGGHQIGVMSKSDIEKIRKMSKMPNSDPWKLHYGEMAKKTVIRRLFKYLPVSIEMQQATEIEDAGDKGRYDASKVLEGEIDDGIVFDNETGEVLSDTDTPTQADELAASLGA
jgi:recombination protein RecT